MDNIKPFVPVNMPKSYSDEGMTDMDKKKLKKVAADMEAEFLKIMMKQMKSTLSSDKAENKAPGKDIMTDFMIERFAEDASKNQPLGIAKMIYDQYTKEYKK